MVHKYALTLGGGAGLVGLAGRHVGKFQMAISATGCTIHSSCGSMVTFSVSTYRMVLVGVFGFGG